MATVDEIIEKELAAELEIRIQGWEAERAQLLRAPARIAELDELIARAKDEARPIPVTRRPRARGNESVAPKSETSTPTHRGLNETLNDS